MTLQEIYDRAIWYVFGNSVPVASVATNLQGATGIIAAEHRHVQEEYNYWFMETDDTVSLVSGTQGYAIPSLFKMEVSFFVEDADGYYLPPLQRLTRGQSPVTFQPTDTGTPTHYELWNGNINLFPTPDAALTLHRRYYAFLTPLVNLTDTDDLTVHGADVLIYKTAYELAVNLDYENKSNLMLRKYFAALDQLKLKHWERSKAGLLSVDYSDL